MVANFLLAPATRVRAQHTPQMGNLNVLEAGELSTEQRALFAARHGLAAGSGRAFLQPVGLAHASGRSATFGAAGPTTGHSHMAAFGSSTPNEGTSFDARALAEARGVEVGEFAFRLDAGPVPQ